LTLSTAIKRGQEGKEEFTKVLYGVQTVINTVLQFLYETNTTIYACVDYTRPSLAIDIQVLKEAFLNAKKRGIKLRYITEITKDNISYCRELLTMVDELRHMDGIKGNFYISEKGYLAPATFHEKGKPASQIIYSNVKEFVEHQGYVFDSFWSRAIPAEQRIREIEEGIENVNIEIIENPKEALKIAQKLIRSAEYEVLVIYPSLNAFRRQVRAGALHLFKEVLLRNVKVRILIPSNQEQIKQIINEVALTFPQLHIKSMDKSLETHIGSVIVDRKESLIVELKDDTKENYYDAAGLSVYSNSMPIALSYTSIFESLWRQTQLYEKSRRINKRLSILNKELKSSNKRQKEMQVELKKINKELLETETAKDNFVMTITDESTRTAAEAKVFTEMLLKTKAMGSLNAGQYSVVKTIHNNLEKLELIVNNILDVYKLDKGKLKLSKVDIDIASIVEETLSEEKLLTQISENNIEIRQEIKATGTICCDSRRIQQTLSNLIKNAIEFVPSDGSGKITIRVEKLEDATKEGRKRGRKFLSQKNLRYKEEKNNENINKKPQEVIFTVEDNGNTVTWDEMQRLSQKFYLIDIKKAFTKRKAGTALGLAISRGIIEAHGGQIWLDKSYNRGAAFKFSLPIVDK
jgi:two-component system sensor histidine kinase VicK